MIDIAANAEAYADESENISNDSRHGCGHALWRAAVLSYLSELWQPLLAVIFGGVVVVFGGYATVYLFGLADNAKKGVRAERAAGMEAADAAALFDTAAQSDTVIPDNLPKLLNNRATIALFDGLYDAGLLDERYLPTPNMPLCQKAYIAGSLCEILNTGQKWDTFEKFWQCSGLRQSYTNACKRDTMQTWRTEVYQTLVDVGSSNRLIFDTRSFTHWVRNDKPNQ